ncbi:hypothetical protein B9Z55_018210 [Caenorhabditis nigoni]|uniref:GH18 domain-containing protein n=1 Tax=Caenorhabditis nigoni TaxID=1611254 RepID=A0A2G5TD38_9PELO|nr:hypothetical protein B9Z55_018210 [Caenorhabditis nigoni]
MEFSQVNFHVKKYAKCERNYIFAIFSLLAEHNLDGVDVQCRWLKTKTDMDNVNLFFEELKRHLTKMEKKAPFIISAFLPHQLSKNAREISMHVDFLTIETSNFYGSWFKENAHLTGPASPLYSRKAVLIKKNIDYVMKEYSCLTGQPNKLNILVEL